MSIWDQFLRNHTDAILTRLREDTVLSTCTFDGVVTGQPQRYCLVDVHADIYGDRLAGYDVSGRFIVGVRSIGVDRVQAQAVAERVFAQLMNFRPVVANRTCSTVTHGGGQPTDMDTDTSPGVWFASDLFTFTSDPVA